MQQSSRARLRVAVVLDGGQSCCAELCLPRQLGARKRAQSRLLVLLVLPQLASGNILASLGAVLCGSQHGSYAAPRRSGKPSYSIVTWAAPDATDAPSHAAQNKATKTTECGSASATARPRTESPSRTGGKAGPSCPPLHNVETSFGARIVGLCTLSITRRRNSGRVYREIHVRGKSQTLDLSLNIPRSTRGRRRGLHESSTLARLGQATFQT